MITCDSISTMVQQQQQQSTNRKVRPEPVNEKTLVGTVVNFLHDAVIDKVPTAYQPNYMNKRTSSTQDIKEPIEWIHYEQINFNNKIKYQIRSMIISNILLIIGYKTGFSIWCIDLNGVATEVLSIKETQISHVKLLKLDQMKLFIAVCKYVSEQLYSISIISLINGDVVHKIEYDAEVLEMKSNSRFLIVSSANSIDGFDLLNNYEHKFKITTCYSNINQLINANSNINTKPVNNPFAIGSRWLAFADSKNHVMFNSIGGMSHEIEQSYTATVFNTAKCITKGITKITESVVNTVVPKTKTSSPSGGTSPGGTSSLNINDSPRIQRKQIDNTNDYQSGICTIIDTYKYANMAKEMKKLHDENQDWIIAHFIAHPEPIYAIEFNHNGRLLVTADTYGQYFNVYQINPNPYKCTRTQVKHLYSLYRGDTTSKVKDISFSYDSRWLAVSTKRGTTHIFPINAYGGLINSRTHANPYVVNRASRHSRTAGFSDEDGLGKLQQQQQQSLLIQQSQYQQTNEYQQYAYNNPKIRTLLEPFVIQALGQIRQPYCGSNISAATAVAVDNVTHFANSTNLVHLDTLCVVSTFAETRGYLSPEEPRDFSKNRLKPISSLFVISNLNGNLIEYVLEVAVDISKTGNKRTNDTPILLKVTPKAQWPLQRSIAINEAKYQLQNDNPLLNIYKSINNLPVSEPNSSNSSNNNSGNNSPNISNISNTFNDDNNQVNNEWIKLVEISTHMGPHRRLFMGPQFVFKTINSNISTTALSATSSAIASTETPLIDLCGDLELNSLDLTRNYSSSPMSMPNYLNTGYSCTPTYIEVGPGSFQDEMPVFKVYGSSNESINDNDENNIIESIADAMNEVQINNNSPNNIQIHTNNQFNNANSYNGKATAAITITGSNNSYRRTSHKEPIHTHSPNNLNYKYLSHQNHHHHYNTNINQNSNAIFLVNDHTTKNHNNNHISNNNINNIVINNNNNLNNINLNDDDSNSSTHSSFTSRVHAPSLENIQFQDDNN